MRRERIAMGRKEQAGAFGWKTILQRSGSSGLGTFIDDSRIRHHPRCLSFWCWAPRTRSQWCTETAIGLGWHLLDCGGKHAPPRDEISAKRSVEKVRLATVGGAYAEGCFLGAGEPGREAVLEERRTNNNI